MLDVYIASLHISFSSGSSADSPSSSKQSPAIKGPKGLKPSSIITIKSQDGKMFQANLSQLSKQTKFFSIATSPRSGFAEASSKTIHFPEHNSHVIAPFLDFCEYDFYDDDIKRKKRIKFHCRVYLFADYIQCEGLKCDVEASLSDHMDDIKTREVWSWEVKKLEAEVLDNPEMMWELKVFAFKEIQRGMDRWEVSVEMLQKGIGPRNKVFWICAVDLERAREIRRENKQRQKLRILEMGRMRREEEKEKERKRMENEERKRLDEEDRARWVANGNAAEDYARRPRPLLHRYLSLPGSGVRLHSRRFLKPIWS